MPAPRLHVPMPLKSGLAIELPPAAARHVQVLRLQPGLPVTLFDGLGGEWTAEVLTMARHAVHVRAVEHRSIERELACRVTLAIGMPANERMDGWVEKATELGAAVLQPLETERSVLRVAGERAERKRAHWQAVAVAACEQCGRNRVPAVAAIRPLAAWLAALAPLEAGEARWLLQPGAPTAPPPAPAAVTVLSGPEGGLSPAEEASALRAGFVPVGLGPRVLRADTAPLAVLAALAWLAAPQRDAQNPAHP